MEPIEMIQGANAAVGILEKFVSLFKAWRGDTPEIPDILTIGISGVGKTTFWSRFDDESPNVFLEFNRNLKTQIDTLKMRREFIEKCRGNSKYRKIDVPGSDFGVGPIRWADKYFSYCPRILIVMVDGRSPEVHIKELRTFLSLIDKGPGFFRKWYNRCLLRNNNLARVLFVINKVDTLCNEEINGLLASYDKDRLLASFHEVLNANILQFQVSLKCGTADTSKFFEAILEGIGRK